VAKEQGRFEAAGVSGPVLISIGDEEKIKTFIDANPGIPKNIMFADNSDTFEAYAAANFGKIGENGPPSKMDLKPPEGVNWFKYISNVGKLTTIKKWNEVPESVLKLGGTFILDGDTVTYGWADEIPGDYPDVAELLKAAGA